MTISEPLNNCVSYFVCILNLYEIILHIFLFFWIQFFTSVLWLMFKVFLTVFPKFLRIPKPNVIPLSGPKLLDNIILKELGKIRFATSFARLNIVKKVSIIFIRRTKFFLFITFLNRIENNEELILMLVIIFFVDVQINC